MAVSPQRSRGSLRRVSLGSDVAVQLASRSSACCDSEPGSGLINVAHQLGGSLGLGVLVTVFAAAHAGGLSADDLLAHQVSVALTVGSAMLVLALVLVLALIVRPGTRAPHAVRSGGGRVATSGGPAGSRRRRSRSPGG
jgi:hypothetical protein